MARRVAWLWGSAYYIGQMLKDLLMLPRPPAAIVVDAAGPSSVIAAWTTPRTTPREGATKGARYDGGKPATGVVRLERHYETEGGMPSTHAMNAISMPWLIVHLVTTSGRFEGGTAWLIAMACAWTILCTFSRLYMGVHSPADIVVGLALGVSVLAFHVTYGPALDHWIVHGGPAVLVLVPAALALLASVYPRPATPRWISTPGDTTLILGAVAGIAIASNFASAAHIAAMGPLAAKRIVMGRGCESTAVDDTLAASTGSRLQNLVLLQLDALRLQCLSLAPMLIRVVVGVVILVATRAVCKATLTAAMVAIVGHEYVPAGEGEGDGRHASSGSKHSPAAAAAAGDVDSSALRGSASAGSLPSASSTSISSAESPLAGSGSSSSSSLRRRQHVPLRYDDGTGSGSSGNGSSSGSVAAANPSTRPVDDGDHTSRHGSKMSIRLPLDSARGVGAAKFSAAAGVGSGGPAVPLVRLPPGRRYIVELPVKFVTYLAVAFNAVYTCQLVFQCLLPEGWGRKGYGL